jgi:sugar O-acyltransferase (sialic acid O-acetyltransferase NeuD family)
MIIIGAKGFAIELLEVLHEMGRTDNLVFYDDISNDLPSLLFDKFRILKSENEVKTFWTQNETQFSLGLGNPKNRQVMADKFCSWGGILSSIISPHAKIAKYGVDLGKGATILANAVITSSCQIGDGLLMYSNAIITHNCIVGKFAELSPGATLLGNVTLGNLTHIGANSTILPNLNVGDGVKIGAGAVVTKNVPDNSKIKGIPAK